MTYGYPIYIDEVNGILPTTCAPISIMKGSDTANHDAANFILTWPGNQPRLTVNTLLIRMTFMLMTHRHNVSHGLTQ